MLAKFNFKKNNLLLLHKLLFDILFGALLFFLGAIFAEGILPGIITSHIGFSEIILCLSATILLIYFSGHLAEIGTDKAGIYFKNKKTALILPIFLTILLFNSLLKINIFLNLFILAASVFCAYFIFRVMTEE